MGGIVTIPPKLPPLPWLNPPLPPPPQPSLPPLPPPPALGPPPASSEAQNLPPPPLATIQDAWITSFTGKQVDRSQNSIGSDAGHRELESALTLLAGWDQAKDVAARLRLALNAPANRLGGAGYERLAAEILSAKAAWRNVRQHNNEMAKLKVELNRIQDIPGWGDESSPLKHEWVALSDAAAKIPFPAISADDHDKLGTQRAAFAQAGRALCCSYESGKAGPVLDEYYKQAYKSLDSVTVILFETARGLPPKTPAIVALNRQLADLESRAVAHHSPKDDYTNLLAATETARKLIAIRTQPGDPLAVAFLAKWAKAENPIKAIVGDAGSGLPTQDAEKLKDEYNILMAELGKGDACDYAKCEQLLASLNEKTQPVLKQRAATLKSSLAGVKAMPADSGTQNAAKAETARTLIDNNHPVILACLNPKEHCDLLDALQTNTGIPAWDGTNKNDPDRSAMRKLYASMSLDSAFMEADDKARAEMVEALKANKQELKDARENWPSMSDKQRIEVMTMLAKQQCASFSFQWPAGGIQAIPSSDETDMGAYSPPLDRIRVNTAGYAFQDFECMLDFVFHENGHKYQSTLVQALRTPAGEPPWLTEANADPPYTQGRMFDLAFGGTTYVRPEESHDIYKKQPAEDHAWTIAPRSARMVLDMLSG